ncbi:carboxypeptidase-like regulatory domain-containing protein [Mucilaginibacter sp. BJC16-A38]|uniref:carboxypeptidase-like regulatory domain-containing protein n=1 Tax=Mucilaginibacter phenanthrenivorans TaxID=1234842 RepID=UPI002157E5BC|nr:carboxypeptidase-like regulatory domain-containing protein [Mucilaginibacter phenanthrenivorans]MCR8556383.1 carboxypeptidase-like regulatory domain-containing protein [Mucilaginibacter phenanthrenivorans]
MIQLVRAAGLTLLCVLLAAWGYAQTVKGTVKDSTGKAVPYATISLKNSAGNAIVAYTVTDSKGSFALQVPANAAANSLAVEARCLGYKTVVKSITSFDALLDFTLATASNHLQEVVIKSSRPILRTHGDTLSYKVSEFANPQDRTIGEVIKKLPGITVAANGTISYNNKPISAVYIGGDNLLDDKYSIATNSIPQVAVNQVQVIQNDQPIKALRNKVMSDDVALNLEIKKGAKLHLMGQESIGVGLPGNYDVDLNALMFKDSYKAINYLGGNNTGYDVQQDVLSHNLTDYNQRIDNALPATVLSLGAVNTPQLAENRYLFDRSGVLNLNNLINLKKNVQLKVNAYYVHDTQRQDYSQQTTVFLPGDTVKYKEIQRNRSIPGIFHAQFTLNINRDKYYLNDALLMDHKNITNYSGLQTGSSAVNQVFKDNTLNFSNEFNLIKSLKSNNIIQAYSYVSHSAEPENLAIGPGYNAAIFNNNVPYAQLLQNVNIPSWYTNNYFSFKIPSNLITQSYRTGFSVQSQTLTSGLNVVQNNNSVNLQSDSALNHLNWTKKKLYAEAAYDLPGTVLKANLTLPLTLQQINYSDSLYALNKNLTRLYFNPQLRLKYQVSAEDYLNFIYSYRNEIGTIQNVYPGYILTDYRTLYANNASLTEQQNQQAGGSFSYRKALTLFFWSINALYTHTGANNIASSVITNNIQKGIVLPYPNSTDSWMLNGSISKYSFALRTTFSGAMQWQSSRSVQIQNNTLLPFNTTSETLNMSADSKVSDVINFNYKATLTQTGSHSPVEASAFRVDQLLQQASVNYDPADDVQFKLSGEHYFTRQQGNPDLKYFFADASLKFRAIKWKTDFELSAVNFLNVKTYNALYLSANTLTASSYTLPGRIIMIKIMFNI